MSLALNGELHRLKLQETSLVQLYTKVLHFKNQLHMEEMQLKSMMDKAPPPTKMEEMQLKSRMDKAPSTSMGASMAAGEQRVEVAPSGVVSMPTSSPSSVAASADTV